MLHSAVTCCLAGFVARSCALFAAGEPNQFQVCSVLSGATTLDHVLSNVKAASWTLTSTEVAEVHALLAPPTP